MQSELNAIGKEGRGTWEVLSSSRNDPAGSRFAVLPKLIELTHLESYKFNYGRRSLRVIRSTPSPSPTLSSSPRPSRPRSEARKLLINYITLASFIRCERSGINRACSQGPDGRYAVLTALSEGARALFHRLIEWLKRLIRCMIN